ncbi:MAG: prepilin-type N-terminal cleavage/methylation domain-containing protein [Candidatus Brocadiae bacterium]|nr:prepilin-type N-terminal cleavage/methylation domain-containing protein [Candidatus Brocadiia bacterium]
MALRRTGFTLIEVLVALAVSAVILAAAGLSLQEVASYEERARAEAGEARRIERLRRALSADLKGLVALDGDHPLLLEEGERGGMRCDRMVLTTRAGLLQIGSGGVTDESPLLRLRRVTYACQREGDSLTLFRLTGVPRGGNAVAIPILRDITHFSVEAVPAGESHPPGGVERVAPDLLEFRVGFSSGGTHSFLSGVDATHRLSMVGG